MKGKAFLSALAMVFSLILLSACQQEAVQTNRPANDNPPGDVMDRPAIEAALLRIENDWPRVVKQKDVATMEKVEADDIVIVYPDGSVGNKTKDIADIRDGNFTADAIAVADLKVNVLDADSAVVTGRSILTGAKVKMPDGKTIDVSGQYRFVDTFQERNGEWKLVAGASVGIGQPEASGSPAAGASPAAAASPATTRTPRVTTSPSPVMKTTP